MDVMAHRKLCRLCLCQSKCFMDVFDENDSLGFTVAKALEDLLQIKVSGDKYPWLACSTCVEKLIDFRLFKSRCLDSKVTFEKRFCVEEHEPVTNPNNEDSDDLEANINNGDEGTQIKEEYDAHDMCKVIIKMEEGEGEMDSDENWVTYNDSSLRMDSCVVENAMEAVEKEGTSCSLGVMSSKVLLSTSGASDVSEENSIWIKEEPIENEEESKGTGNSECGDDAEYEWPEVQSRESSPCADFHPAPGSEQVPFKVSEVKGGDSIPNGNNSLLSEVKLGKVGPIHLGAGGDSGGEQGTKGIAACVQDPMLRNEEENEEDNSFPQNNVNGKGLLLKHLATENENSQCEPKLTTGNERAMRDVINPETLKGRLRGNVGSCDTTGKQSVSRKGPITRYLSTRSSLQCPKCNLLFKSSIRLKKHLKWHKSKTPAKKTYECPKCGKGFSYLQCYKTHLKKHAKMVIYQCPKCHKFFGSQELIVAHMKTHVSPKTHRCQYCDMCFNSVTEHVAHEFTHSGTREFVCGNCDSSFFTLQQLKLHETVHIGEQPYECKVCGSSFKCDETLNEHQQSIHHVRTNTVILIS